MEKRMGGREYETTPIFIDFCPLRRSDISWQETLLFCGKKREIFAPAQLLRSLSPDERLVFAFGGTIRYDYAN